MLLNSLGNNGIQIEIERSHALRVFQFGAWQYSRCRRRSHDGIDIEVERMAHAFVRGWRKRGRRGFGLRHSAIRIEVQVEVEILRKRCCGYTTHCSRGGYRYTGCAAIWCCVERVGGINAATKFRRFFPYRTLAAGSRVKLSCQRFKRSSIFAASVNL